MIKKQIPNLFTLLNLLSGMVAIIMTLSDNLIDAAYFVFLGIFFDFFDGFFARKFKVEGEFGKQLDSLADMITSGVVPGMIMFQLLLFSGKGRYFMELTSETGNWHEYYETYYYFIPLIGLIIPMAAAFRLAKFNLDERQTNSFIGLPTPALSLFVVSLPLIIQYSDQKVFIELIQSTYILIMIVLGGSYLLNAELPLFSLKFKNYSWVLNRVKYIFIVVSLLLLISIKTVAIPLVILLYLGISLAQNHTNKTR